MSNRNLDQVSNALTNTSSRRQALKLMGGGILGGAAMAAGLKGATAQRTSGVLSFPVNFASDAGSFVGTFDVTSFLNQDGQVFASGTLTGTVTNLVTDVTQTITQPLELPLLGSSNGTCDVLHLELGPLDLNLLGLVVHLDRIVLDITAEQGALLGDLLCAVANLLDGGNTNALTRLLNQVLNLLG